MMESWSGHHYSELMASWGPPQQVFDDGNGGRVLVWTANRSFQVAPATNTTMTTGQALLYGNQIFGSSQSYTTYQPAQAVTWTAYRMFWVNSSGHVYTWAWRGL